MSIISFGNRSLGVKIGEVYYYMLIRAISFSVNSISSLDITTSIFFSDHRTFLGFSWFFLFFFFVLRHFRSVLAQPHTSLPIVLDHSLSFGGLTTSKIVVFLNDGCGNGDLLPLWPRKIHCLCNHS